MLARQVDIAPTVLSQIGVTYGPELFEGRNLTASPEHEHAYSSCWYEKRCMAEITGNVRAIDHYDNQPMEVYDLSVAISGKHTPLQRANACRRDGWSWSATFPAASYRPRSSC